jgi:hypothetical protein
LLLTALAAPAAAVAPSAEVPASAPLRALVLLQPQTDDILARIRGQTSDLRVELLVASVESMPGDLGAQTRRAHLLGQQRNASLVIWFVNSATTEPHFIVNIAIPDQSRLLTRDLGPSDAASGSLGIASAVKESAALVVRAAIQAVLGGSTIGDAEGDQVQASDVVPTETSPQPAPSSAAPAPKRGTKSEAWRDTTEFADEDPSTSVASASADARDRPWAAGAEWLSVYDSATGHSLAGCALFRVERRVQWFGAFVKASSCLNREIDAGKYGKFRIARQQATLGANVNLLRTWFDVSLGVELGAVVYERTTLPAPGAEPAQTHVVAVGGPEFRLLVPARGSRIQCGLTLGLDFATSSVKIGYRDPVAPTPDHFAQITQLSLVQPYAALGLALRW